MRLLKLFGCLCFLLLLVTLSGCGCDCSGECATTDATKDTCKEGDMGDCAATVPDVDCYCDQKRESGYGPDSGCGCDVDIGI